MSVVEWRKNPAQRGGGGRRENLVKSEWDVLFFLNVERVGHFSG